MKADGAGVRRWGAQLPCTVLPSHTPGPTLRGRVRATQGDVYECVRHRRAEPLTCDYAPMSILLLLLAGPRRRQHAAPSWTAYSAPRPDAIAVRPFPFPKIGESVDVASFVAVPSRRMETPQLPGNAPDARLIGVPELAEWLGVNQRQVRKWVETGTVPVTRLDRRVRFDVVAIEKWLKRNTQDAA